jgi:hypothetical protein
MIKQTSAISRPILVKVLAMVLVGLSCTGAFVASFAVRRQTLIFGVRHRTDVENSRSNVHFSMQNDLFADLSVTIRTDVAHNNIPTIVDNRVIDKSGREFTVGSIVRVCVDGLKAYQVNGKAQGSYNDEKVFVSDTSETKKKCLLVPAGLRGQVIKVYDEDVISSNLPIVVQFTPGENTEDGYDVPTTFRMHFTPQELDCI